MSVSSLRPRVLTIFASSSAVVMVMKRRQLHVLHSRWLLHVCLPQTVSKWRSVQRGCSSVPPFCHYLKSSGERSLKTIRETASSDGNCSLWDHSPRKARSGKMAAASHSRLEAGIAILWQTAGRLLWGFSLSRSFSLLLAVLGTKDLGVVCMCVCGRGAGGRLCPPV